MGIAGTLCKILYRFDRTIIFSGNEKFEYRKIIEDEARLSFFELERIYHRVDNDSKEKTLLLIQEFLKNRWQRILNTDAAYVQIPGSYINKICFILAQLLAKENSKQSSWQYLMPTLVFFNYYDGTNLLDKSKKEFLYDFIITDDNKELLPISFCLRARLYNKKIMTLHDDTSLYENRELSELELFRLKRAVGITSIELFNEVERRENRFLEQYYTPVNLREAVDSLCNALIESGTNGRGNERLATGLSELAVHEFYKIWVRPGINNLSLWQIEMPNGRFLNDYFINLFHHSGILVDDQTVEQVRKTRLIRCVNIIANDIKAIVNLHEDDFNSVVLNDLNENHSVNINKLLEDCGSQIKHRSCFFSYQRSGQERLRYTNLYLVIKRKPLLITAITPNTLSYFSAKHPSDYFDLLKRIEQYKPFYENFLVTRDIRKKNSIFFDWAQKNLDLYYQWIYVHKEQFENIRYALGSMHFSDNASLIVDLAINQPISYLSLLMRYADNKEIFRLLVKAKKFIENDSDASPDREASSFSFKHYALVAAFNDCDFYKLFMKNHEVGIMFKQLEIILMDLFFYFPASLIFSLPAFDYAIVQRDWFKRAMNKKVVKIHESQSQVKLITHWNKTNVYNKTKKFICCYQRLKEKKIPTIINQVKTEEECNNKSTSIMSLNNVFHKVVNR